MCKISWTRKKKSYSKLLFSWQKVCIKFSWLWLCRHFHDATVACWAYRGYLKEKSLLCWCLGYSQFSTLLFHHKHEGRDAVHTHAHLSAKSKTHCPIPEVTAVPWMPGVCVCQWIWILKKCGRSACATCVHNLWDQLSFCLFLAVRKLTLSCNRCCKKKGFK